MVKKCIERNGKANTEEAQQSPQTGVEEILQYVLVAYSGKPVAEKKLLVCPQDINMLHFSPVKP